MGHFTDTFKAKIDAENCTVRLSVRSSDERVDEHIIDVRDFNAATQEVSDGWCGTDLISTKRAGNDVMIAIRESDVKRIIYRVTHQHWRLVCEEFLSGVRTSGIEIQPYIIREKPEMPRIPIEEIVDAVTKSMMPSLLGEFATLQQRLQTLATSNFIQVTAVKTTTESSNAVFIPNDIINTNLTGNAQINSEQSSSDALAEALEALKQLKSSGENQ